ncbi:MAG: hypothetical protein H0W18_15925 [Acidobacteria bacterium]|nr:hypothetical protein [Acidobacteriota bacterium]
MHAEEADRADAPRPREFWTAAGIFAILTAVLTYPLSVRAGSVMVGDNPDAHLFIWTFAWLAHAFANQPLSLFDANIFHPLQHTLAFSENLVGSGLIAAPVIWITGNPFLALNAVSLLSVLLCGCGAYVLARRLGLGVAAAFICGIVFAFSPARFFRIGQLHLTTVQWIPFALAYLHTYLDRGRARDLRIAVAFFTLQALTTGHGAVFLAVAIAVVIAERLIAGWRRSPRQIVRDSGVTGGLLLVPAILIAIPYQIVQREMGLRRFLENWTVAGVSYIASPSRLHQAVINLFTPVEEVNATAHAYLFPGYLPILLSVMAIGLAIPAGTKARRLTICYGSIALISALLIAGPPLGLWPLVYWLPGFNFIRVPSRFVILLVLALAVLSALAIEWITGRLPARTRRWTVAAVALLMLGEFAIAPLDVVSLSTRPAAAERWLADQPKPFVVAEVPMSGAPREQTRYMLHSMAHWQNTVHGYSGIEPPQHTALYAAMKSFPDTASVAQLRAFGVTYIVVHIDGYPADRWPAVESGLSGHAALDQVFQDARSRVYRVRYDPPPSPSSRPR